MRKSEYEKYIKPEEFLAVYNEWKSKGKPRGNDKTYEKVWDGVQNAVKACIGSLQARYKCTYQNYDDKVLDATILVMNKLNTMEDEPRNIVTMSYLYVVGICCGSKTRQQEFEDNMLSVDAPAVGGDSFADLMYIDEYGVLQYNY